MAIVAAILLVAEAGPPAKFERAAPAGAHAYGGGLRANEPWLGVENWMLWIQIVGVIGSGVIIGRLAYLFLFPALAMVAVFL